MLAGGIGSLVIIAMIVLVGLTARSDSGASPDHAATGTWGWQVAFILSGGGLVVLLGGSWYIARRLRDLQVMERDNDQLGLALLHAAEAERTRLGQNLHDDLGQHLTAIGMLSESLRVRLHDASPPLADDAARLARLAEEAGDRARALTRLCVIDWTDRAGLVRSIESLCRSATELFGFGIETRIDPEFDAADPAVAPHIARIVSEAINNAARHDEPAGMLVSMRMMDDQAAGSTVGRAELLIEPSASTDERAESATDHGAATSPSEPGLGMAIMRARAGAIGGWLEAIERPGRGITIRCVFPWKHPPRSERPAKVRADTPSFGTAFKPRHLARERSAGTDP